MEKRCNQCNWEFYEADMDEFELEDGIFKDIECCPECGSNDIENKLMGYENLIKRINL